MQISRHWRLNAQRYRLQGVRYGNGEISLQNRPVPLNFSGKESEPVHASSENVTSQISVEGDSAIVQTVVTTAA